MGQGGVHSKLGHDDTPVASPQRGSKATGRRTAGVHTLLARAVPKLFRSAQATSVNPRHTGKLPPTYRHPSVNLPPPYRHPTATLPPPSKPPQSYRQAAAKLLPPYRHPTASLPPHYRHPASNIAFVAEPPWVVTAYQLASPLADLYGQ